MIRVPAAVLTEFASEVVASLGAPAHVADCVGMTLVNADLSGHRSHGNSIASGVRDESR